MSEGLKVRRGGKKGRIFGAVGFTGTLGTTTPEVLFNATDMNVSTALLKYADSSSYERSYIAVSIDKKCKARCFLNTSTSDNGYAKFPLAYCNGIYNRYTAEIDSEGLYCFELEPLANGIRVTGAVTGRVYQVGAPAFYIRANQGHNVVMFADT